jgi:hypothetical protein
MEDIIDILIWGPVVAACTFFIWAPIAIIIGEILKGLVFEPLSERSERKAAEKKAARLAEAQRLRDEKENARRAKDPSSGGSYSSEPTGNYANHLWYGDHSEMDWRDREQAQSWGMDADTYASNYLND